MADDKTDTPPQPPHAPVLPEKEAVEEFPEKLYCPQCRRMYPTKTLRAKSNTLLTEAALVCPRCRRKLRRMKLKDWYDHYVQGQRKDFNLDTHGFLHQDPPGEGPPAQEAEPPRGQPNRNARPPQGRAARPSDRGRNPRPDQQGQKKSRLPQNIRAYRLPKRRRER